MPLHDFQCDSCGHHEIDRFWATFREVPNVFPCSECGTPMTRLAGRFTAWGPVSVWNDAAQELVPGPGRAQMPGCEVFAGTPFEDAARAGETVNKYLEPDHPGYYKRGTNHREHFDLGS